MRIAAIAERGRHRTAVERHLPHQVIDRTRGHARADVRGHFVEDFRREPPGLAHALESGGAVQLDGAIARKDVRFVHDHIFGHGAKIAALAENCDPCAPLTS